MKYKKTITLVFTVLVVVLTSLGGLMKLLGNPELVKTLEGVGVGQYRVYLGLAEIAFVVLFVFPKTMKLGFILLSCYFAGALATELSHGSAPNALLPIVLVWIATWLRDESAFLTEKN